jgi:hypothetical protein
VARAGLLEPIEPAVEGFELLAHLAGFGDGDVVVGIAVEGINCHKPTAPLPDSTSVRNSDSTIERYFNSSGMC